MKIKTYADWDRDLDRYLQVGDVVDEEMYCHFLDVMPPATNTSRMVQLGEPYSHVDGKATYSTLERTDQGWVYRGVCHRGATIDLMSR